MNFEDLKAAMLVTAAGKIKAVTVDGWGTLYVKSPTVAEIDASSAIEEPKDGKQRRFARGACNIICDENGARVFDAKNEDHVELLASQPWDMLQQVMAAADIKVGTDVEGN